MNMSFEKVMYLLLHKGFAHLLLDVFQDINPLMFSKMIPFSLLHFLGVFDLQLWEFLCFMCRMRHFVFYWHLGVPQTWGDFKLDFQLGDSSGCISSWDSDCGSCPCWLMIKGLLRLSPESQGGHMMTYLIRPLCALRSQASSGCPPHLLLTDQLRPGNTGQCPQPSMAFPPLSWVRSAFWLSLFIFLYSGLNQA